ncbi:DUF6953 family protein [Paraburkholderia sp. Cpub6]|uniref:DUF6953 family protein n=1 Tax=Paraburkholderia sp. Cpub6 TaxID=2723094 RepID=UPI00390652E3
MKNTDGDLVVGKQVLARFRKLPDTTVVWVKPDRYWRYRAAEEEPCGPAPAKTGHWVTLKL